MATSSDKNGEIVKKRNYGFAEIQHKVSVKENTVFPINSMTKAFTGVALVQLSEQGKLSFDDEIGKHIADLPEEWKSISIQQLMTHTSGLPEILSGYRADLIVRGNPETLIIMKMDTQQAGRL
ncbi:serine hydrolase domain-containing protein [Microbulbifer sp. A4B17]|uniref:serine hydrolase domain-containing protein n=1 Tax=Microbulbifer sp. A4B17 TaxID=359370 RepID=UPI00192D4279